MPPDDKMQCESEGEITDTVAADTLDNEANNIQEMISIDEQMIGFKGQHGVTLRISPIPVGYGSQFGPLCDRGYNFSFVSTSINEQEHEILKHVDRYTNLMMSVDRANQLRNNHHRGGWRERVATRCLAAACQMKYFCNVN